MFLLPANPYLVDVFVSNQLQSQVYPTTPGIGLIISCISGPVAMVGFGDAFHHSTVSTREMQTTENGEKQILRGVENHKKNGNRGHETFGNNSPQHHRLFSVVLKIIPFMFSVRVSLRHECYMVMLSSPTKISKNEYKPQLRFCWINQLKRSFWRSWKEYEHEWGLVVFEFLEVLNFSSTLARVFVTQEASFHARIIMLEKHERLSVCPWNWSPRLNFSSLNTRIARTVEMCVNITATTIAITSPHRQGPGLGINRCR